VRQASFPHSSDLTEQAPHARKSDAVGIEDNRLLKDGDSLNVTSRFRVLGNIGNQLRVFPSEARAQWATGQQRGGIRR
jgi:hypothetical protein